MRMTMSTWVALLASSTAGDRRLYFFSCFSEDQVFHFEKFEFALLERKVEELKWNGRDSTAQPEWLISYYSLGRNSELQVT